MRNPDSTMNVHDTQTAIFDFGNVEVVWNQRNWGENPEPKYGWGATLYGDKGTLKLSVFSYDFTPNGGGTPVHGDFVDERDKYPADTQHKETEMYRGAGHSAAHAEFSGGSPRRETAGGRY